MSSSRVSRVASTPTVITKPRLMRSTEFITLARKGKLGPAYFLRGPDGLLHEECRRALITSVPAEARSWCLAEIEFEPGRLARQLEGAHQMPMLGGRNYLLFSDPEDFKQATDDDVEALRVYLERPSPFATVVFAAAEPDRRRRFVQLLEKKAVVVEIEPLTRPEAVAWLKHYLHEAGVEIDADLAGEIVAKFEISSDAPRDAKKAGVNLLWMRTEVEKLLTAKPDAKRLERGDLQLIVAFREEYQVGKFLRALAERKCGEALEHLRALLASRVAETLLLWCIADLFRLTIKSAPRGSYGRQVWGGTANPFSTFAIAPIVAAKYSREELLGTLRKVRRADLGIKSSWKDSKILLEYLVWQIIVGKGSKDALPLGELPAFGAEAQG